MVAAIGPKEVKSIYAFVGAVRGEDEGIIGGGTSFTGVMPMVFADERLIEKARPVASLIAKRMGAKVRLVKFDAVEEMEVFDG